MPWNIILHRDFWPEFERFEEVVQDEILASLKVLEQEGPNLGRPLVDTLNGSAYPNMKELRIRAGNGVWRIAFAFDPLRQAVILAAGNKAGLASRRFYDDLIRVADRRYGRHLAAQIPR